MKKAKQFLAALLCLCMAAAVIPANAQQAAATDGDTSVEYNFMYTGVTELADIAAERLGREHDGTTKDKEAKQMQLIEATSYYITGRNWHFLTRPEAAWTDVATTWGNRCAFSKYGIYLYLDSLNRWVAFVLKIEDAADYDVAVNYYTPTSGGESEVYMFPKPTDVSETGIAACLTEENSLGTIDSYGASLEKKSAPLKGINVTEPNSEYVVVFRGTGTKNTASSAYWSYINGLTLTKKETVSANFGEHYAYMEKSGDGSYMLTVIGGIKDIEGYSKVGFEVTVNGEKITQSDEKVYKTITHNGNAIDTSKLGENITHLFYQTFEIDATSIESLSFKAYAEDADGNAEYGTAYVLN